MLGDDAGGRSFLPDELCGRAVTLSRFADGDQEGLFDALDHDELWTLVPGRPADADHLGRVLAEAEKIGRYPWVIRLRQPVGGMEPGSIIGTTSYLDVQPGDARCEIGFTAYHPDVWGTVVNAECKLLLLGNAFDAGYGRVQLKTDILNDRSQRAIAKLGAQREGVLRRYQHRADGSMRDTVMFSILADEWPQVRESLEQRLDAALG